MIHLQSNPWCTSVKCASVVYVFGGKLRQPDPIEIVLDAEGREDVRYCFESDDISQGFAIGDLICAYSILTRGIPKGIVPRKETLDICNDSKHAIHHCFRSLNERDRLHRIYFEAQAGHAKAFHGECLSTSQTKLAASLAASGHKECGVTWDGKSAFFQFREDVEMRKLADAYDAAWSLMLLPKDHPIYWMKSVLDRRDELLGYKNGKLKDMNGKIIEPMYREQRGGKTIFTPLHASKESIEKSKKYLNA